MGTMGNNDLEALAAYYKNRIMDALEEYKETNSVQDLHKLSKTRWKAVLSSVYDLVFKPARQQQKRSALPYDNVALLDRICDLYIMICNEYEKDISIYGFCLLTGISYAAMMKWRSGERRSMVYIDNNTGNIIEDRYLAAYRVQHDDAQLSEMPSAAYTAILEKLNANRQESLKSITLDGSIPALALGKIEYGWIEGGLQQKQAELLIQAKETSDLLTAYRQKLLQPPEDTTYSATS